LPGLVHHSDRGAQYSCQEYVELLQSHVVSSMSRPANPYDNAFCESFIDPIYGTDSESGRNVNPSRLHRFDESPVGYSLASCSPAELAFALPATTYPAQSTNCCKPKIIERYVGFVHRVSPKGSLQKPEKTRRSAFSLIGVHRCSSLPHCHGITLEQVSRANS